MKRMVANSQMPKGACIVSHVLQVNVAVAPEVIESGKNGEKDGGPSDELGKPDGPRDASDGGIENFGGPTAPVVVANANEDGDDGDNLGIGLAFAELVGGKDDIFVCGQKTQTSDGEFAGNDKDNHPSGDKKILPGHLQPAGDALDSG